MKKSEKLEKELKELSAKQDSLWRELQDAKTEEDFQQYKGKYKFMIVNSEVKPIPEDSVFTVEFPDGLPVMVDCYGMGACHWSLIEKETDAKARQLLDNVVWATNRLRWARENNTKEVPELLKIILSGGKTRLPSYWQNMPGDAR